MPAAGRPGDGAWRHPLRCGQKQISGSAVAHRDRPFAQLRDCHSAKSHVRLCRREGRHQVPFGEGDAAIQPLFASVDPGQHERYRQCLESAAHGKALIGAIADELVSRDIQHSDAKTTAAPSLKIREPRLDTAMVLRGTHTRRQQRRNSHHRRSHDRPTRDRDKHVERPFHRRAASLQTMTLGSWLCLEATIARDFPGHFANLARQVKQKARSFDRASDFSC